MLNSTNILQSLPNVSLFDVNISNLQDKADSLAVPITFTKVTSDPEFTISGVLICGCVGIVSFRWVNLGQFHIGAWDAGVKLATMNNCRSTTEIQSVCTDVLTCGYPDSIVTVASAVGQDIAWRSSVSTDVPSMWHEA